MRNILAHINLLFALIFLISAGSAFGQNSVTFTFTNVNVDSRAVDLSPNLNVFWASENVGATVANPKGSFIWGWNVSRWSDSQWNGWKIPSQSEMQALISNTSYSNSTKTFTATATNYNSSITIPTTNYHEGGPDGIDSESDGWMCWSTTTVPIIKCNYTLRFCKGSIKCSTTYCELSQANALPIRPVIDKVTITLQFGNSILEKSFPKGSTIKIKAEADDCYTFSHWSKSGDASWTSNQQETEITVTADATYIPNFTIKTSTIITSETSGGDAYIDTDNKGEQGDFNCGATVVLKADPADCYTFVRWIQTIGTDTVHIPGDNAPDYITSCTTDNTTGKNTLKVVVPSDVAAIDYHAVFAKRPLTVTAAPNDGGLGTITDSTGNHNYATTQTFGVDCGNRFIVKATPSGGCIVVEKWVDLERPTVVYTPGNSNDDYTCTTDEDGVNTLTINSVNKQLNLKAVFVKQDYYIDSDVQPEKSGKVEITYSEVSDICDRTISLEATPNECYAFKEWKMKVIRNGQEELIDLQGESTIEDLQVTESTTFVAYFEIKDVTVTIKSDTDQGTVEFVDEENDQ